MFEDLLSLNTEVRGEAQDTEIATNRFEVRGKCPNEQMQSKHYHIIEISRGDAEARRVESVKCKV